MTKYQNLYYDIDLFKIGEHVLVAYIRRCMVQTRTVSVQPKLLYVNIKET